MLCLECTRRLERLLAELPSVAADLDTTRTRTSRTGGRGIGIVVRSGERPVPWDDRAARLSRELAVFLSRWVARVAAAGREQAGPACFVCRHLSCLLLRAGRPPVETVAAWSTYLLAVLPALRFRPEVTAMADGLDVLIGRVEGVIDRPEELTFFGPCGAIDYWPGTDEPVLCAARCAADLYGPADAASLKCSACGAEHDVTKVRAFLLEEAQDQLVTAADLSKFLSAYGEPLKYDRVRKWVERELLVSHGKDRAGHPLFRVSEAVELLSRMAERKKKSA